VGQLEREAATREGLLSAKADEVESLQVAAQEAQAQCNQYVMDLQVMGAVEEELGVLLIVPP